MKTASARAIALVGVWAAAGCAGPGKATNVDPAKPFLAVSIGPRQATWTRNFNPLLPSALFPAAGGIYEPLLVYNRVKAAYIPWLATSYAWSAHNTRLAFAIRAGEYTSARFTGFPDQSSPYARLAPHDDPEPLLVMRELKPRVD